MDISLTTILFISALGGALIQMIPSIGKRVDELNKKDEHRLKTQLQKQSLLDRYGNYLWPISSFATYVYIIVDKGLQSVIEHIFAIIFATILPIVLLVAIGLPLLLLSQLVKDKSALLFLSIIALPGVLMALFSEYEWVVLSCVLAYILMIGLWIKESAGWFGVIFTVVSIFVSLYIS